MTNKTLSQQICEICGIEPKYQCSYHSCICPIQDIGKFNSKCPKQAVTEECDGRSNKPCYIDFENNNNNNFVKLLEIYFDCKNIKEIILNSILDDFMQDKTNNDLSIDYYYSDLTEKCEKFKQAIKNEQWEV